jgi:Spy/CpxP family protein refolding chaperone
MNIFMKYAPKTAYAIAALAIYSAIGLSSTRAVAQMPMPSSQPAQSQAQPDAAAQSQDTQEQITQLKEQVAKLQAALQAKKAKKTGSGKASMGAADPAMGMEGESSEMGGMSAGSGKSAAPMNDDMDEDDAMAPAAGAMKSGDAKPMAGSGCCGMSMGKPMAKAPGMGDDKMGGMSAGKMPSKGSKAMSGMKTAEAPHLLHVGAKDFYLDHAQQIGLTPEQKTDLEKIKAGAVQQKVASQKQIDVAEQELWQLTSADQPDSAQIDTKVQEIAKSKADQQVTFIHAVSSASDVLTMEQRAKVVKLMPSTEAKSRVQKPMSSPMKMQ